MKILVTYFIFIFSMVYGQVCCSLVGTVNTGSSTVVSAHYPSDIVFEKNMMWNTGLIGTINFHKNELIKYPFANNGYIEISDYLTNTSIWFLNASMSAISLNETVSFDKTSTYILGGKGQFGIRNKLIYNMGFIENSLIFPLKPFYSNEEFAFKTGVVPSYSFSWINTNIFESTNNIQVGMNKNFKEKNNVFIDNNISLTFWREEQLFDLLISPYISIQQQKLIAPLTPYDENRDARLMRFVYLGMNLIPLNQKFDFMQFNLNIPIYSWVSKIGFPDGTIPSISTSLTVFSSGVFKKETKSRLFD